MQIGILDGIYHILFAKMYFYDEGINNQKINSDRIFF